MKSRDATDEFADERHRVDWVDAYAVDTQAVLRAALRRGIPARPVEVRPSLIELGTGAYRRRLSAITTSMTPHTGCEIARSKHLTNHILRGAGVPVPWGETARTVEEAIEVAARIGYPVVLKPVYGSRARGVFVDLDSGARVGEFYSLAAAEAYAEPVLVERYVSGRDYRVLVIGGQVVAVLERVPAFVVGNGVHTVRQLIDAANADPRRGQSEALPLYPIHIDVKTTDVLAQQGLTVDDVPRPGMHIKLKPTGSIRGGGAPVDRTGDIHPDNARVACLAAKAVDLDIAGIDIVTPDISQPMLATGGAVLEVNHGPGFNQHLFPAEGQGRDPGPFVIDMLFPPGQPVRAPVVAVTAGPGSVSACQLIAHILATAGKAVGLATSEGVVVDGLYLGGIESGNAAGMLLDNPAVEVAVVEVDARGAGELGSAFDACDVAVMLSRSGAERVLLDTLNATGTALFNADDPEALALASSSRHDAMLMGMDARADAIRMHVASGGRAVVLKRTPSGAAIALSAGGRARTVWSEIKHPVVSLEEGELTHASLLAAVAAAIACEIPVETIRQALQTFRFAVLARFPTSRARSAVVADDPEPSTPRTTQDTEVPSFLRTGLDYDGAVVAGERTFDAGQPQQHSQPKDPTMPELTIGMATYKDFDGVYFTIQALRLYQDVEGVEFLVVDNYGCDDTRRFVASIQGRYVRATESIGSAAAKNVVFQEARGHAVLCCDSHVLFPTGVIAQLKDYHRTHPDCRDLLQGPLVYDDLSTTSTHFDPVWRGQMWGIWASDPRGADPGGEPFDIPMQGMGAFSCRTGAWPGFNPAFRGFGGEEGYIHEKFRQAGGRCLCLPWFRWTHRFARPAGVPYPLSVRDKIRNYMIGFIELGLGLDPIYEHFAEFTAAGQLDQIYAEVLREGISAPATPGEDVRSLADF